MKKMSLFALLLAAVLVTSYSVSGTYAKYTSTFTSSDTARVAKWAFNFEGDDVAVGEFTFDLFKTAIDANVAEGTAAEAIIAPGTEGSFKIGLANASEVNAKYSINYTVTRTNEDIPVQFTTVVDGEGNPDWSSASYSSIAEATDNINMGGEAEHTVYWRWVFEGDNTTDTTLGTAGTDTITVEAVVTATQID